MSLALSGSIYSISSQIELSDKKYLLYFKILSKKVILAKTYKKLRKFLSIALIPMFLLAATVGITLKSYSCKEMAEKAMAKPCCKNLDKGGCCKKESTLLKIQDAFIKTASASNLAASFYFTQQQTLSFSFATYASKLAYAKAHWDNAPPDTGVGFYILYHSLII